LFEAYLLALALLEAPFAGLAFLEAPFVALAFLKAYSMMGLDLLLRLRKVDVVSLFLAIHLDGILMLEPLVLLVSPLPESSNIEVT
jgi:hypothetical protein